MSQSIEGLGKILSGFDGVLVDQYGVLHNGRHPFREAQACMEQLYSSGVPVVVLTNSGKRAQHNVDRLEGLGFPRHWFRGVVSSGEIARQELCRRLRDGRLRPGDAVGVISRDADLGLLEGLELRAVDPSDDCSLLLIAGAQPERIPIENYDEALNVLASRGVLAMCANPDTVMYVDDEHGYGPGRIAERYRAFGGQTLVLGKPSSPIFLAGRDVLGRPAPTRVLMIGDSVAHDLVGAAGVGFRTLLVRSGVQSGLTAGDYVPDYTIERLTW